MQTCRLLTQTHKGVGLDRKILKLMAELRVIKNDRGGHREEPPTQPEPHPTDAGALSHAAGVGHTP